MLDFIETPWLFGLVSKDDAHTAIDHKFRAGDKTGFIARDKCNKIRYFFGRANTLQGLEAQDAIFGRFGIGLRIKPTLDEGGSDPAGADGIDTDVIRGVIEGQVARQAVKPA